MELNRSQGRSGPAALVVAGFLVLASLAYFSGLVQTLGQESRRLTYSGPASSTNSGGGIGLKRMLFLEGQTFFADYQAEVHEGSLRIGILETFGPVGRKPHLVEAITESGSGEVTFHIPKTGLYSIYFNGSVLGNSQGTGYDVAYTVRWGVR